MSRGRRGPRGGPCACRWQSEPVPACTAWQCRRASEPRAGSLLAAQPAGGPAIARPAAAAAWVRPCAGSVPPTAAGPAGRAGLRSKAQRQLRAGGAGNGGDERSPPAARRSSGRSPPGRQSPVLQPAASWQPLLTHLPATHPRSLWCRACRQRRSLGDQRPGRPGAGGLRCPGSAGEHTAGSGQLVRDGSEHRPSPLRPAGAEHLRHAAGADARHDQRQDDGSGVPKWPFPGSPGFPFQIGDPYGNPATAKTRCQ